MKVWLVNFLPELGDYIDFWAICETKCITNKFEKW